MSTSSPSYASVVAGVKSKKTAGIKRPTAATTAKSRDPPLELVKKFTAGGGEVLVEVESEAHIDSDAESAQLTDTETEEDAGKYLDADDSMYRGKPTRNRVDPPPSIIQTRRARARDPTTAPPASTTAVAHDGSVPRPKPTPVRKTPSKATSSSAQPAGPAPSAPIPSPNKKKAPTAPSPTKKIPRKSPKGKKLAVSSGVDEDDPSLVTPKSKRRRVCSNETVASSADESDFARTPRRLKRLRRSVPDVDTMEVDSPVDSPLINSLDYEDQAADRGSQEMSDANDDEGSGVGVDEDASVGSARDPDDETMVDDEMSEEQGADADPHHRAVVVPKLVESEAEEADFVEDGCDDRGDTDDVPDHTTSDDEARLDPDQYDLDDPFIDDTGLDGCDVGDLSEGASDLDDQPGGEHPHVPPPPSSPPVIPTPSPSKPRPKAAKVSKPAKKLSAIAEEPVVRSPTAKTSKNAAHTSKPIAPSTSGHSSGRAAPPVTASPSKKAAKPLKPVISSKSGPPAPPTTPASSTQPPLTTPTTPKTPRRAFGSMATPSADRPTRYLQDLQYSRLKRSWEPKVCGVSDEILQDEILKEDYVHLCRMQPGTFSTWSETPGDGMMYFSDWSPICPNMNFE